ncbi:MAG: hypothetical protein HYZ31_12800 [Gammaproteobacteria bacterium]|nr:hypothetical protein [Gammaproteobacteria bacterium]
MNLFFWKKNRIIDDFAIKLANELYSAITPDQVALYFANSENKKQNEKIQKKLDNQIKLYVVSIKQFKIKHSIGIYGKARLHLKFMERLKELGYNQDISKRINELLLISTP